MTEFKEGIESVYDSVGPEKVIFNEVNKARQIGIVLVWGIAPFIACFWFSKGYSLPEWVLISSFAWIMAGIMFMFFWTNSVGKKKLSSMGIEPTKGFFNFWANRKYREYKVEKFEEELKREGFLKDNDQDIALVEDYLDYFDTESKNLFNDGRVIIGGVILAFSIPVWNQFLTIFFKKNEARLIEATLASMSFLLVILSFLGFIFFLKKQFTDYLNRRSDKFAEIAKLLKTLHLNLKLKYSSGTRSIEK